MTIMQTIKSILGIRSDAPERAAVVAREAEALTNETRELNAKLRPYADSPDPFKALLIDLSNARASRVQNARWEQ